jgi:uncharacterized protein YcbX
MSDLRIKELYCYPVKSFAGVELHSGDITLRGISGDREFMVVDLDGTYLSQRQIPEMALVKPSLSDESLLLEAPGVEAIEIPLDKEPDDSKLVQASVHGNPVLGQEVGNEVNEWLDEALPEYKGHKGYRMLRIREDKPRFIKERYRDPSASNQVGFADGHSLLLTTDASLQALNNELETPVPMNRFRPNIVVSGDDLEPYDEDFWTKIKVSGVSAFVVKACDRCAIPDVDQSTAEVGKDVRKALVSRKGINAYDESNKGVFFGQNLNHVYPGADNVASLMVGEVVEVLERSSARNVVLRNG